MHHVPHYEIRSCSWLFAGLTAFVFRHNLNLFFYSMLIFKLSEARAVIKHRSVDLPWLLFHKIQTRHSSRWFWQHSDKIELFLLPRQCRLLLMNPFIDFHSKSCHNMCSWVIGSEDLRCVFLWGLSKVVIEMTWLSSRGHLKGEGSVQLLFICAYFHLMGKVNFY